MTTRTAVTVAAFVIATGLALVAGHLALETLRVVLPALARVIEALP